uniref:SCP domain-containing protein n=1 Tax=Mesocestoides corti TaxID=53468 RepID=A0A5K3FBY5_MESCO
MLPFVCLSCILWCVTAQIPTQQERDDIVEFHTALRENVKPEASNMEIMSYSMELENLAQDWSESCNFHEADSDVYPQFQNIGQVFASGGRFKPTFSEILPAFAWARDHYDYENDTCKGFCDDYKQVNLNSFLSETNNPFYQSTSFRTLH